MTDDLNKKIKQITDVLGQDKIPDNLMGLLGMLAGSMGKEEQSSRENEVTTPKEEKPVRSEAEDSFEMLRKAKKLMDRMNSGTDPKLGLLVAIKPFLSNRRQDRLNTCIRILQMSNLVRFIDDNGKDSII